MKFIPYIIPPTCTFCGHQFYAGDKHMQWFDEGAGKLPTWGCQVRMLCSNPATCWRIDGVTRTAIQIPDPSVTP